MTVSAPAAPKPTDPPATDSANPPRLAWLDALRGIAALAVALHHASYDYTPHARDLLLQWFDPGTYGVMVFFLISGYIIPSSLERGGSVRRFWIGRLFRIYPLWGLACGVTIALIAGGLYRGRGGPGGLVSALAHLTMLQDLLAAPNMLNVLWTLSYEMAFYLIVVALFMVGLHRHSAAAALLLAAGGVMLGKSLPQAALSAGGRNDVVIVATAVLFGAAIILAAKGRTAGGVLGGALALILVLVNGRISPSHGLIILAIMFTGTAIYRAEKAQLRLRLLIPLLIAVLSAALVTGVWMIYERDAAGARAWCLSVLAVAVTFGVGMALRHRHVPRALTSLGTISYSVYLLHPVLLAVMRVAFGDGPGRPEQGNALLLMLFVPVLLALSWTTQRCVEAPMQRLGRRLAIAAGREAR